MRQLKIAQSITNRTEDSISRYLMDIAQIELLHQEEEVILAKMVQNGDTHAMEKLVKTNLRFVVSVAKQYQNKGMALSDLISEGNLGLIKAAHRFDYTKGFKFISFAVYWIRQSIIQAISDQKRVVRLPGNQINDMQKVSKAMIKLEQHLERMPTIAELAETLELSEEKVADILCSGSNAVSVDVQCSLSAETTLLDVLANQNSLNPISQLYIDSLSIDMIRMLNRLPEKQKLIIKYFYGIDGFPQLSFDDIAFEMRLTSERVRQLRNKAIDNLKKFSKVNMTIEYLQN
ncbi:RNA polymerase sigma factor RpoD/SigA [Pedobacter sp. ASV1-7]|uniref:sigma-70 family RNA polymerase sigma factor n=1 Tax=Pedobacter sp. ASV1-7 TaxID=3145237 RepID=UPI0032E93839